jgi:hypothetical protein
MSRVEAEDLEALIEIDVRAGVSSRLTAEDPSERLG